LGNGKGVRLGSAFYYRKNPDHLPPRNFAESAGDKIRWMGSLFNTKHAAFGVRGACAIMTTGIISFLRQSQDFYFQERFLWSQFAVLLSMSRTAGASTFALLLRFFGTVASMIASYIFWYVVDEKTPGILVFLWLWLWVLGIFCKSLLDISITSFMLIQFSIQLSNFHDSLEPGSLHLSLLS
jgi:hypothetical protein